MPAAAIAGAAVVGSVGSSLAARSAAKKAANAQTQAANMGIDEQRRQFDAMQQLLAPYVQAGTPALQAQMNLLGLNGAGAQEQAVQQQQESPFFQSLAQQGENAILQNASATGGLRGGNVQGALGQFRPALLNQFIQQQYGNLAGLTQLGQNSAAGVGNAGLQTGANIANLLGQAGAARAGGALAQGQAMGQLFNLPSQALGAFMGAGGKF